MISFWFLGLKLGIFHGQTKRADCSDQMEFFESAFGVLILILWVSIFAQHIFICRHRKLPINFTRLRHYIPTYSVSGTSFNHETMYPKSHSITKKNQYFCIYIFPILSSKLPITFATFQSVFSNTFMYFYYILIIDNAILLLYIFFF